MNMVPIKTKFCKKCGVVYLPKTPHSMYCITCNFAECSICKNIFSIKPSAIKKQKFCSTKCAGENKRGVKFPIDRVMRSAATHRLKKTGDIELCATCGSQTSYRYPKDKKRKTKNFFCSTKCHGDFKRDPLRPLKLKVRDCVRGRTWCKKVYARDNHCCQKCGQRGQLHAHHIKPFAAYPELVFDINNGIALCKDCHQKEHSLMGSIKDKSRWKDFPSEKLFSPALAVVLRKNQSKRKEVVSIYS